MANRLKRGTVCMVKSAGPCKEHNGKVVVVQYFDRECDGYQCEPRLYDCEEYNLIWIRASLVPLEGGDGVDEVLRIVGAPKEAECAKN
jgi:hypothetical protein